MSGIKDPLKRIISRKEAIEALNLTGKMVDQMVEHGELESVMLGGKLRIARRSVERMRQKLSTLLSDAVE